MHYEYVFIIWLYVLLDVTYGYKRNKHCKKVFVSFIYILLLELISLGAIYLIINNVLPDYVMRKNLIFFVMLILVFLALGLGCYEARIIKKIGDEYKIKNKFAEMLPKDRALYHRCIVFSDEYAWVICLVAGVMSFIGLLWTAYTGNFGEIIHW